MKLIMIFIFRFLTKAKTSSPFDEALPPMAGEAKETNAYENAIPYRRINTHIINSDFHVRIEEEYIDPFLIISRVAYPLFFW